MIINFSNLMFITLNIMSTLYMISANCWINCFLAMEINLFFFIPMIFSPNLFNMEMIMKYFIIQVTSSIMILLCILYYKNFIFNLILIILMNFCLLMKLGSVPFHYWYIEISNIISWKMFFMLSTWQKLGPMMILLYNFNEYIMIFSIIMNSTIGMLGGLNQISLKKIMSFSSINHLSWIIASSMISEIMMMIYIFTYTMMMFFIMMKFEQMNLINIFQLFFFKKKMMIMISFFIYFMSLGGLPPLMGFIPKWLTINKLMENKFILVSVILIMSSLINLYYYFKIVYYMNLNKNYKINFFIEYNFKFSFYLFNYLIMTNLSYLLIYMFYY
uniref:NADH-ubiquinone oxidoreductase chain 2 n=1 Tax=Plectrocnemia tortosa TaxID=623669 RepID=A0A9E8LQH5_9NEOP|nr:NADH dehydrogenase subunit 2 [Plectrocnemia tortosa]UZZ44260.1 NADH dehydrogenase subunit 2 [Plectrocnemia tortosa]